MTRAQSMTVVRESSNRRLGIQSTSDRRTVAKEKKVTSGDTTPARPNRKTEAAKKMIAVQASYSMRKAN